MSRSLRKAVNNSEPYIQSPVDEMHSFLWTAMWATLFNVKHLGKSSDEVEWRDCLRGDIDKRESVAVDILVGKVQRNNEYSPLLRSMIPVLKGWRDKLFSLDDDWDLMWGQQGSDPVSKKLLFHRFAFRGVMDFVGVVMNEREALQGTSSGTVSQS